LTVETEDLTAEDIVKTVKRTGFTAEAIWKADTKWEGDLSQV
jgi:hypothetical protein